MQSVNSLHSQISQLLKKLLPKLERTLHKGQNGKVGIVGGSKDYTGAPYYAATSSLKSGADIAHIFCSQEAVIPIKCYSPEFIVHPCLYDMKELNIWLNGLTSIVIGPGLGRDESTYEAIKTIIDKANSNSSLSLVGDADFLWFLSNSENKKTLIESIKPLKQRAVLTPNIVEFARMVEGTDFDQKHQTLLEDTFFEQHVNTFGKLDQTEVIVQHISDLAQSLNNVIICKKGIIDIITDGQTAYYVAVEGNLKRCGGQGDVFSGIVGTFSKFADNLKEEQSPSERALLSVVGASIVTRCSAHKAFVKKRIGLTTPDIISEIPEFLAQFYFEEDSLQHKL